MRKIEKLMLTALHNRVSFHKDNTTVVFHGSSHPPRANVQLHGNLIATVYYTLHTGVLVVLNSSVLRRWPTATSRSRVSALVGSVTLERLRDGIDEGPRPLLPKP